MKIDFSEIEKGFRDSLEKSGAAQLPPLRSENANNWAGIPNEKLRLPTRGGTTALSPVGFFGITPGYLDKARELYEHPPTTSAPFLDYVNKDKFNTYTNQTLVGKMTAPLRDTLNQGYNALGWVGGKLVPTTEGVERGLRNSGHGELAEAVGTVRDTANLVNNVITDPNAPKPTTSEKLLEDQKSTFVAPVRKGVNAISGMLDAYRKGDLSGYVNQNYPQMSQMAHKAQETWQGLNGWGQAALPLGGAALAYYLMNRRKKQQAQQQPININIGGRPIHPMFDQRGVASFGQDKFGQIKQANIVVDSLANAVRSRMANKVIDKVVAPSSQEERPSEHSEKEIELTSKYPEMSKLLEDKQNKAYLERLLKE